MIGKKNLIPVLVLFTVLFAWSGMVYAQPPAPGGGSATEVEVTDDGDAPEVIIDITQQYSQKYAIAVPDFLALSSGSPGPADVSAGLPGRLGRNLDMTGYFVLLDKREFLEEDPSAGIKTDVPVNWRSWTAIGANYLVKGGYQLSGDQLVLELRAFNVVKGEMILGKRYSGSKKDGVRMINRFANELLYVITGEAGVFGTRIVFVSGSRANKSIMATEFGSDEVVGLAGGGGPYTQPAVGPGGQVAYIHRSGKQWQLIRDGKVLFSGPLTLSPCFTPGGGLLAAISGKYDTNIFSFGGARPAAVTKHWGINISPTVSPDGGRMAFVSNRAGGPQIYISSTGGGAAGRLTTSGKQNTDPNWSPRGDRIVFVRNEKDICTINPDGSDLQQLTYNQGVNKRPTFSPDGRLIVFTTSREGVNKLYVMTANGERQQPLLPNYNGDQHNSYWSPVKPEFSPNQGG